MYIFVSISISSDTKFMHILLNRLSMCLLILFAASLSYGQEEEKGSNWAESVDDTSIDFGGDLSERSAREALNEVQKISRDIQLLKGEVIDLNKDLRLMEEKLLFPSSTKFSVFVSVTSGQFFALESIKLKIDGRFVATHIYPEKQRKAFLRGGIHKLYITNLSEGNHQIIAFITGIGPGGRAYKRAAELEFEKGPGSQYLEIAISDDTVAQEPVFEMKEW